jgi:hypothetical protein
LLWARVEARQHPKQRVVVSKSFFTIDFDQGWFPVFTIPRQMQSSAPRKRFGWPNNPEIFQKSQHQFRSIKNRARGEFIVAKTLEVSPKAGMGVVLVVIV